MLPFHDHHSFLEKSFSEQLELNPHLSPRNFYLPSSPPSFYIPEGLHDILNYLPTAAGAATMLPSPLPVPPLQGDPLDETKMGVREAMGNNESVSRRRFARKDRHSKIYTATGPRDRRMRLSLEVARKFFDLQDMLRFDKASQTVQWLLNKSKGAIRELASVSSQKLMCSISHQSPNSESYTSECEDVVSTISDSKGKSTMLNNTASEEKKPRIKRSSANKSSTCRKAVLNPTLAKESRAKARERARERTKEKKRMCWTNSSTSFNVVEDESGLMQQNYLTPQSFEERYLSSHNYQYSIRASNEKTDHYDELQVAGGSDLTPILDYGTYNHNTATSITDAAGIFQEQWDMERVLLTDGQIHSRQLMEVFNSRPAA